MKHTFRGGGVYKSTSYFGGLISTTHAGNWKKQGGLLVISGTPYTNDMSSHFSGSLKLVDSHNMVYTGDSSGVTIKITATKREPKSAAIIPALLSLS